MGHVRGLNAGNFRGIKGLISPTPWCSLSPFLLWCWRIANLFSRCDPKSCVLLFSYNQSWQGFHLFISSNTFISLSWKSLRSWAVVPSESMLHFTLYVPHPAFFLSSSSHPRFLFFSHLPPYLLGSISPSSGYHLYAFPFQSCPEEILRTYFPSKVDLFKVEFPCLRFLILLLIRQTFLHVVFFFFFLAAPCGMWDLSFPTRDRTCAPCIGSEEY